MHRHYALTGTVGYYRPLPTKVELREADTVEPAVKDRLAWLALGRRGYILDIGKSAPIEGPFNSSRWKDPPHVELANLHDDPAAALRFTRSYGVLALDYQGEARTIPVGQVLGFRDQLRSAWDGDEKAILDVLDNVKGYLWVRPSGTEIVLEDLWTLIRVMFARDMWDERVKKCQNPDCPAPFFIAVRKGQKFCTQKCAVLINVRHFREREAQHAAKSNKNKRSVNRKGGKR